MKDYVDLFGFSATTNDNEDIHINYNEKTNTVVFDITGVFPVFTKTEFIEFVEALNRLKEKIIKQWNYGFIVIWRQLWKLETK